ncbi:hypothetical protein [Aquibium sp. ELW1220]|uniref:hypothetical protein n=1 Tax=Aquibium sp. ELW1220 TaxID=2976766 RepID=UPI0025B09199|nr:hypothetical protein [Aquibium sp. ELW1220]MDN2580871.1 hypothetical protein [Aquibium sp. ELW1220]
MVEILGIERSAIRTSVKGRLLQKVGSDHIVYITIEEDVSYLKIGDVFSACFSHVSFFDIKSFGARTVAVTWYRDERWSQPIAVTKHLIRDVPNDTSRGSPARREVLGSTKLIRREHAPKWLKQALEKRRNKRQRKSEKKKTIVRAQPPRILESIAPPPEGDIDKEKMIEMLSKRFRITTRKEE